MVNLGACTAISVVVVVATSVLFAIPARGTEYYSFEIVKAYPHDHTAFTQGLEYEYSCKRQEFGHGMKCQDILWESTGMWGRSTVRAVDLQTGEVLKSTSLHRRDFAEGLVKDSAGHLVQLLYQTGKAYKYNAETLEQVEKLDTGLSDGWGLATDGKQLYATDSSTALHILDQTTLKVKETMTITWEGRPVKWVNELEWIDGEIWGNIWQTECIARIDPNTAEIKSWILMEGLTTMTRVANQWPRMDVLNGIAWDARKRRIFVTGKYWPKLYEVTLQKMPETNSGTKLLVQNKCLK